MKHLRTVHVTLLLLIAACIPALAQTPDDYSLSLATGWELSAYTDGAKVERVEYIYGDRSAGLLKVKRVRLDSGETLDAYVDRDTAVTLRFLPGFVQGRQERFAGGAMAGMLVQFDFTKGGKPMLGRYYYLAGPTIRPYGFCNSLAIGPCSARPGTSRTRWPGRSASDSGSDLKTGRR